MLCPFFEIWLGVGVPSSAAADWHPDRSGGISALVSRGRWKLAAVGAEEEPSLSNPLEALEQAGFNGSSSKIGHRERDSQ